MNKIKNILKMNVAILLLSPLFASAYGMNYSPRNERAIRFRRSGIFILRIGFI